MVPTAPRRVPSQVDSSRGGRELHRSRTLPTNPLHSPVELQRNASYGSSIRRIEPRRPTSTALPPRSDPIPPSIEMMQTDGYARPSSNRAHNDVATAQPGITSPENEPYYDTIGDGYEDMHPADSGYVNRQAQPGSEYENRHAGSEYVNRHAGSEYENRHAGSEYENRHAGSEYENKTAGPEYENGHAGRR